MFYLSELFFNLIMALSGFLSFTQFLPNIKFQTHFYILYLWVQWAEVKRHKKIMLQEHSFTSFFPKSPPGFMVAKIRNFFPAVNSSTSLSLSSRLPFSANNRDFSTSRTLEGKLENVRLEKASVFYFVVFSVLKKEKKSHRLCWAFTLVNGFLPQTSKWIVIPIPM